ncbi:MAG TPA: DUF3261 domain-containing protein [Thermoanaerobaculia bacterium]|jgi:hypothetical protein
MKRLAVALLFVAMSCSTGRPTGAPVAPLAATSAEDARAQLDAVRARFHGMRSLMRVRATVNGKTQSFRAQLAVHDEQRMELIAYTPVGTTALKMKAEGDRITSEPEVAPEAFAFLRETRLTPAQVGMLLLGIPMSADAGFEATGLSRARAGAWTVTFEPPAFPAQRVVVTSDNDDRIEIEHEEVVREN